MLLENKLNLLSEKINTSEFLLLEMKKIGIEKLPYSQSSLKRFIDSKTMDVHYNGHYKTYVKKLNDALSKKNYGDVELEDIIKKISKYDKTIRNNAGGAFNHALFWKMLSPTKKELPKEIKTKIIKDFGSYNDFKKEFTEVAKTIFGSGWAWLIITKSGKLKVMSTPNQDNPLMNVIEGGGFPILGLDTWEHAYYLKYQNKRDEYIKNFWDVVNWDFVNDLYLKKQKSKLTESVRVIKEQTTNGLPENEYIVNGRINPKLTQELLSKVYPKCDPEIITDYDLSKRIPNACYGKIDSDTCKTGYGVIGGKYAMSQRGGIGEWSVLNWFDGNKDISKKILEFYGFLNSEKSSFKSWMNKMKNALFAEDRKLIQQLLPFISNPETKKGSLDLGITRENTAVDILNSLYSQSKITRFCDGDLRDKFKGQDMIWNEDNVDKFVQVKPTHDLFKGEENGQPIYVFKSKNKYDVRNIQIFAFIYNRNNYILFNNNATPTPIENNSNFKYSYTFKEDEIMKKEGNLFLKKLTESKRKNRLLLEDSNFPFSKKRMRDLMFNQYPSCDDDKSGNGCIGKINEPNCETNIGIIGGYYTEEEYGGTGNWSLINRWDANTNIHSAIINIYKREKKKTKRNLNLEDWILENAYDLFSNDGIYTEELVDIAKDYFDKGIKNESFAKNIIEKIYDLDKTKENIDYKLYNYCGGAINDTLYGQDIVLELENNEPIYFQVKPFKLDDIGYFEDDDRGFYYGVKSYNQHNKYKMDYVDIIIYVNTSTDEYVMFRNDYNKIITTSSTNYSGPKFVINYYEEPLKTNISFELKKGTTLSSEKKLLRRDKEKLVKYYQDRIQFFQDKLKDLGISEELSEGIKQCKIQLLKLLTQ